MNFLNASPYEADFPWHASEWPANFLFEHHFFEKSAPFFENDA